MNNPEQLKGEKVIKIAKATKNINGANYIGYNVKTTNNRVSLFIEEFTECCEVVDCNYSIIDNEGNQVFADNIKDAEIYKINWNPDYTEYSDKYNENTKHMSSITILTSKGNIELSVSNEHNGYYSHMVYASWGDYENTHKL